MSCCRVALRNVPYVIGVSEIAVGFDNTLSLLSFGENNGCQNKRPNPPIRDLIEMVELSAVLPMSHYMYVAQEASQDRHVGCC